MHILLDVHTASGYARPFAGKEFRHKPHLQQQRSPYPGRSAFRIVSSRGYEAALLLKEGEHAKTLNTPSLLHSHLAA